MLAKINSGSIYGLEGYVVEVEVALSRGLPRLVMVGLPDSGCQESCDRVRAALVNSGFDFPLGRLTINLAPARIKKAGTQFDLPVALGILLVSGQIKNNYPDKFLVLGELALDGLVRPVRGVLPVGLAGRDKKIKTIILPRENVPEAGLVSGLDILAVSHLRQVIEFLEKPVREMFFLSGSATDLFSASAVGSIDTVDMGEIRGQQLAKRALAVAAAGGHNLLMVGPPGSGKTMLARALPSIMPQLSLEEALEVTRIYSVAGQINTGQFYVNRRPFRAPHHTASEAGIIGGGSIPRPGEVTMAHRGILFLDELTEFNRRTLEVLRQPLEDGCVTISRAANSFSFPARFLLVAAANPCPCGFLGDGSDRCRCGPAAIQKYWGKISGPLLDRIDLQIEVPRLKKKEISFNELRTQPAPESSDQIRQRVLAARERQASRYGKEEILNGQLKGKEIKKFIRLDEEAEKILEQAAAKFFLSYRSIEKILKVSRTIADLENSEKILTAHLTEALNYRMFKNYF